METEILQTRVTSGRSGSGFQNNSKLQHAGRERDTREQGKRDGAVPSEGAGTEARRGCSAQPAPVSPRFAAAGRALGSRQTRRQRLLQS